MLDCHFSIRNCLASECKEKWGRRRSVSHEPNFNCLQVYFVSSYLTELVVKCWHMIRESVFLFPSQPAHGLNCQWEPQSNHRCLSRHRPSKRYAIPLPPRTPALGAFPTSFTRGCVVLWSEQHTWGLGLLESLGEIVTEWGKPFLFYNRVWYFFHNEEFADKP